MEARRTAGLLIFVAGLELILGIMIAEFAYPGYNVSTNYISDLGVWDKPSAIIFNPLIIVYGSLLIGASYMLRKDCLTKAIPLMFCLSGIGAIGVGIFNESVGPAHAFFALIAFLFGGLAAILSSRMVPKPLSLVSTILGATGLAALVLFAINFDLGLGIGGMERVIAYPVLLWSLGFGGFLLGQSTR